MIKLSEISTKAPKSLDKDEIEDLTRDLHREFDDLAKVMFAQKKYSLLTVFQGMDASGKDGAIRYVFRRITPFVTHVKAFKKPTDVEFAHDFLWRVHQAAPEKGKIAIFNRSHYEDVLIQRVHNWIDEKTVKKRFKHINNFEDLIADNGTQVLKFYLHNSKEEQLERLKERETIPRKFWKFNPADYEERKHWDKYMEAYEDVFKHCGPDHPWHIIPSEQNWYKEYMILKTIVDRLRSLNMDYPPLKRD